MRINVGARIRTERKARNLSQADLERLTGFPRCRISYLENGRAVPTIETLEKLSDALGLPLYQLFCDGSPPTESLSEPKSGELNGNGRHALNGMARVPRTIHQHVNKMDEEDQKLLLFIARKLAKRETARFSAGRQSVRQDLNKGKGAREGRDL